MNKKRFVITGVVLAVMMLTIGTGAAQSKDGTGMMPPYGTPLLRCINRMNNMTSETKSAIDALVQARKEAKRSDFSIMKTLMDTYFAALTASSIDETALASAQKALVTHMQADMQSNFALDKSIVRLLSADELTALSTCMANIGPPQPKQ